MKILSLSNLNGGKVIFIQHGNCRQQNMSIMLIKISINLYCFDHAVYLNIVKLHSPTNLDRIVDSTVCNHTEI